MESNAEDPALWDEDRVVWEVCIKSDSAFARVPDRIRLEQTLRDNDINGECLLELGMDTLKHELGLQSFGQRREICKAIKSLQNSPGPWSTEEKVRRFQEGLPTPQITHSRLSLGAQSSPGYFPIEAKSTVEPEIAPALPLPQIQHGTSSTAVHLPGNLQGESSITQNTNRPLIQSEALLLGSSAPTNTAKDGVLSIAQVPDPQPSFLNSGEGPHFGNQPSRLSSLNQPGPSHLVDSIEKRKDSTPPRPSAKLPRVEEVAKTSHNPPSKPKRRIAPTVVHSLGPQKEDALALNADSYYGYEPTAIQDIFYRLGAVDSGRNFELLSEKKATGFQKAVASLMRHYLRQPVVPLPNTPFLYRMPYQAKKCAGLNSKHLFSLFLTGGVHRVEPVDEWSAQLSAQSSENVSLKSSKGQLVKVTNEPMLSLSSFEALLRAGTTHKDAIPGFSDFEYLLAKYKPRSDDSSDILPLYGDSGDENDFDDETWAEIEAEQAEKAQAASIMSKKDVLSVIDDAIRGFEEFWQETKLPRVKARAYPIWIKANTLRIRQAQKYATARSLSRYEGRLTSLRDAVLDELWQKAPDILLQCQSMEETVFSILECRHIMQVLESDKPPEKPNREAVQPKPKVQVPLPDGEEILDSDDDLDAFLAEDSSSAEDIPFALEDHLDPEPTNQTVASSAPKTRSLSPMSLNSDPPQAPITPTKTTSLETAGDEADIESEEEVLSSLAKKRRYLKQLTPRKPKKHVTGASKTLGVSDSDTDSHPVDITDSKMPRPRFPFPVQSQPQVIDLTMSDPPEPPAETSSSDFDVRTPPLNPVRMRQFTASEPVSPIEKEVNSSQNQKVFEDMLMLAEEPRTPVNESSANSQELPPLQDVLGIRRLAWDRVTSKSDRVRALYKAVYKTASAKFRSLCTYLDNISNASRTREDVLKKNLLSLKALLNEKKATAKMKSSPILLAAFFVTYVCSKPVTANSTCSPSDLDLAFENVMDASKKFFVYLSTAVNIYKAFLETSKDSAKGQPGDQEDPIDEDESSDYLATDEELEPPQSAKKRKRAIAESQEAKAHQTTDQQRVKEQELRRKAMEVKFAAISSNENAQYWINTVEPFVPLDPHISARVKTHQLAGIQFLWREIIDDPKHQGCLLAHTMGLGKSMQIISLLVTIAQCNRSQDPRIQAHIPKHLKRSQTLILCPPTLLDNWYDEIVMWLPASSPDLLGTLYKIRGSEDIDLIEAWKSGGGVVIMSYDLFRYMLSPKKSKQITTLPPDRDLSYRQKLLLETANLVVADEAHKMKNAASSISRLARGISTRSRIALTGSPLNNHLEEYHTMVDWIFPGYLGEMVQFRAKYVEPIHQGLYAESTARERRVCLKKLHVLKQDLAPKVNRADITAISKDLPPKTEYVITLPLTDLQRQAYDSYAKYMLQAYRPTETVSKNGLFSLISILSSLCNHPWIFLRKFDKRLNQYNGAGSSTQLQDARKEAGQSSGPDDSDAANSSEAGPVPEIDTAYPTDADVSAMEEAVAFFREFQADGRLHNPELSYRAAVVQQILRKSIAQGDKVLVFSHSLDTLDYLELLLDQMKCNYLRIDGKTPMKRRQEITKLFNNSDNITRYSVCLISTRAGGLGLNFQGANRVIIYDFGFNPMWEEQAVGRAYRLGQKRPVHVYRFKIGGTVEEVVINKAIFKTQLFSRVVDKKNPTRQASNKASDYLFLVREVEQQDFKACLGKDPGVLDEIIKNSDKIRNIELTETFQIEDNEQLNDQELKEAEEEYDRQRLARDDPEAYRKKYGHQHLQHPGIPGLSNASSAYAHPNMIGGRASYGGAKHYHHNHNNHQRPPPPRPADRPSNAFRSVGMSQVQDHQAIPGLRHSILERANAVHQPSMAPQSRATTTTKTSAPPQTNSKMDDGNRKAESENEAGKAKNSTSSPNEAANASGGTAATGATNGNNTVAVPGRAHEDPTPPAGCQSQ